MALADILLDVEYVPFILYMSFPHLISLDNSWEKNSWGWSAYMIFHAHFSVIIHNVSIWLTLSVAIWRFIMIRFHHLVPVYCTVRRCHILLFSAYGMFQIILNVELKPFNNKSTYIVGNSSVFTVKKGYIYRTNTFENFWGLKNCICAICLIRNIEYHIIGIDEKIIV